MKNESFGYWAFVCAGIIKSPLLQSALDYAVELEREQVERVKRKELWPDLNGHNIGYIDTDNTPFDRLTKWNSSLFQEKSKRVRKMERQRELGMI